MTGHDRSEYGEGSAAMEPAKPEIVTRRYSFACECGATDPRTHEDYWAAISEGHQHQQYAHEAQVQRDSLSRVVWTRGELKWSIDVFTPGAVNV